jgi:hypothetical protein
MYCPKCGTETSPDRKFCRSCGLPLEPVSQLLTGWPLNHQTPTAPTEQGTSVDQRRRMLRLGFITMWAGLLSIILMGIIGEAISSAISPESSQLGQRIENLAAIGVIPMLLGVGLMIYSRLLAKSQPQAPRAQARPLLPESRPYINSPGIQSPVSRPADQAPSVTEHTTFRLEHPESRSSKE